MRCCGADVSGKDLILAIVECIDGELAYEPTSPPKIRLGDDEDQASVRSFLEAVSNFMRVNNIDLIAVKKRSSKGKFAGGSTTFKIEGMLQIIENCRVVLYAPTTIAAKEKTINFPKPDKLLAYQTDAYRTACCAIVTQNA